MQNHDPDRAFQLIVLVFAHVPQLFCDISGIDLRQPAGLQQRDLLLDPSVKIMLVTSARLRRALTRPARFRRRRHTQVLSTRGNKGQLSATLTELSASS